MSIEKITNALAVWNKDAILTTYVLVHALVQCIIMINSVSSACWSCEEVRSTSHSKSAACKTNQFEFPRTYGSMMKVTKHDLTSPNPVLTYDIPTQSPIKFYPTPSLSAGVWPGQAFSVQFGSLRRLGSQDDRDHVCLIPMKLPARILYIRAYHYIRRSMFYVIHMSTQFFRTLLGFLMRRWKSRVTALNILLGHAVI